MLKKMGWVLVPQNILKILVDMTFLGLSAMCSFFCSCTGGDLIPAVESQNVLEFLLESKFPADSTILQSLYEPQIKELLSLNSTAYSIYSYELDFDEDGENEIISFFVSVINSGSLGNFNLDIWEKENDKYYNIGPDYTFYLNPRINFSDISISFILDEDNDYPSFVYQILDTQSIVVAETKFIYTNGKYRAEDGTYSLNF